MLASDATPGNHDEAAIAAALATDPAWHWTVPPPAVASRLQRSDFDDEEAWNSHRCKRRAQQKALNEKSRAPRDRSQRARPARARQQEERRQRRESQQIERQEALCEAARVLTARRVAAAGQSQPPPPLIGLGESEPVVRASIHLRHKLRLADVDASKEELAQMSAASQLAAEYCRANPLPPAPADLQRVAAMELRRQVTAQTAAKQRRLAKQKPKPSLKPSAGIGKAQRWRRVSGPRADGRRAVRS